MEERVKNQEPGIKRKNKAYCSAEQVEQWNTPGLFTVLAFHAFQQSINSHGVPVAQVKIVLQPFYNIAGFYAGGDFAILGNAFFGGKFPEIIRPFACFLFDGI